MIYNCTSVHSGLLYEFDCNCGGGSTINVMPVSNLTGELNGHEVILNWSATPLKDEALYHVYRNGVEIGQTTETTYTDEVFEEMVYTYCVVVELYGSFSAPACIQIEFVDSIDESEVEFSIYPNPVNGTLYVNGGNAEYSYQMFNGMGQKVAEGKATGNTQINVSDMSKGVYFLRLTSGTQISMEKVVVE